MIDAVFPTVPRRRGHYESFYLKATHPDGGQAVWIRYTVHKHPGAEPVGSLWCTVFDTARGRPTAVKETLAGVAPATGAGALIRLGASRLEEGRVVGRAGGRAAWDLSLNAREPPLAYLPLPWMYRAPVPRTKAVSMQPVTRVDGELSMDDRTLSLEGWEGMVGHNWGSEHAERWVWLHASGFDERPDAWLDVTVGRVRVGRAVLPWIANGALMLDGRRHRLGGLGRSGATRVETSVLGGRFMLRGDGVVVNGSVSARSPDGPVVWRYADPGGSEHHTANCSVADLELDVVSPGASAQRLTCRGRAVYELGMREHDHGLVVEPYPDP